MYILLHMAVLTVTVLATTRIVPSVKVKSVGSAIVVALVFSVLNVFLGWLIRAFLIIPAILTLGLLFLFVPFIVNAVLLWLTDKLLRSFEIETFGGPLCLGGDHHRRQLAFPHGDSRPFRRHVRSGPDPLDLAAGACNLSRMATTLRPLS